MESAQDPQLAGSPGSRSPGTAGALRGGMPMVGTLDQWIAGDGSTGVEPGAAPAAGSSPGGAGEKKGGLEPGEMWVKDLGLPPNAPDLLGHERLNRMQADSVRAGLLEGSSVLVSAPTSSGKTLVAQMAILAFLARRAGRAVYLCPLQSLVHEKYRELKGLRALRVNGRATKVAMSAGKISEGDKPPEKADILVTTNERMDSTMRKGRGSPGHTGLMVVDEIHGVGDKRRGPVLETIIAHAKSMKRLPQIVGLSATAPNAEEVAGWLGAALVQSEERPVSLDEGVYNGEAVIMDSGRNIRVERGTHKPAVRVGLESALRGEKTLVFAMTKRDAIANAKSAAGAIGARLSREERKSLESLAERIIRASELTDMVRDLASIVRQGAAFHHSDLGQECREAIEGGFRDGPIRLVSSTSTLAAGVNLPARRVVVSSFRRYDSDAGRQMPISVREYKQMAGRAGRLGHGDGGEAIIAAENEDAGHARERYVRGKAERIESRMVEGASMQTHLLSLVVICPGVTEERITDFFLMTLAAIQHGREEIRLAVGEGLEALHASGLVNRQRKEGFASYVPSELGRLATRRYIEPQVALDFQRVARIKAPGSSHTLGLIYAAVTYGSDCRLSANAYREPLEEMLADNSDGLFTEIRDRNDDVERTTLALWHWIDEASTVHIADKLGVEPGPLRNMASEVGRLVRCIGEVSRLDGNAGLAGEAEALAVRIENGVRAELLGLVGLRHVGRAHARSLYARGYETRESLRDLSPRRLAQFIPVGEKRASEIIEQASAS